MTKEALTESGTPVPLVGEGAGDEVPEIGVGQEQRHHDGEGGAHDPSGDLHQQDDRRDAEPEVRRLREGGAAQELVQVDDGIGDGGHSQSGEQQVRP